MITEAARQLRENIQKVVVGKDEIINMTLAAVLCEGHILLEDVPGDREDHPCPGGCGFAGLHFPANTVHPRLASFGCYRN